VVRTLRAFAWIRWRMLLNSFEHTGSRDRLERFSIAIEKLAPIVAAILLIPSALFLAALGVAAGYTLGSAEAGPDVFSAVRYLLIPVPLLAVVGPLLLPSADRTNPVRLLLLPIPRATLYVAQASASFGDVWTILMLALLAGVPIGLAAAGAGLAAFASLAAGALLVAVVVGAGALATSVLHLVVRDRRRGELLALLFIILIPAASMLPGLLGGGSRRARDEARGPALPAWVAEAGSRAAAVYPTEMFVAATRAAAGADRGRTAASMAALLAFAAVLHGGGLVVFRRILDSPGPSGPRRIASASGVLNRTLPGLSPAASAVALAHLRLALRTPRGRSILLSPLVVVLVFALLIYRNPGSFAPFGISEGLTLAAFGSFVSLMSVLPMAMNQFAVDRAGLTFHLLAPLSEGDLLAGKAAGNALIALPPALITLAAAFALFPQGPASLWLTLVVALPAIYLPVAPVAAILSAVFPRAVDMNSVGRGSNAHGAAGLLGMLAFVAAALPPLGLAVVAMRVLERPALAPVFVLLWCGVAYVLGRALYIPARRIVAARRENLATLM